VFPARPFSFFSTRRTIVLTPPEDEFIGKLVFADVPLEIEERQLERHATRLFG